MRALALCLLLILGSSAGAATSEVWVDAIHGDDVAGLGTAASPYRTITKGVLTLTPATGPTTVHVAPGSYGPTLGEAFPVQLQPFMSLVGSGAYLTEISGEGNGLDLVRLASGALISDMTLTRADTAVESIGTGSVSIRYVRRCVVRDSLIGLRCADTLHSDSGNVVVNSVIIKNVVGVVAESTGYDFQSVSVLLYGTTVTKNGTGLQAFGVLERYLGLFDSIVRGNQNDSITGWSAIFPGITGNVLGDPAHVGSAGNINVDPAHVHPGGGDLHLKTTSPVIDNPAPPVVWPPNPMWVGPGMWTWESSFEEIVDLDGDDRLPPEVVDPGADEVVLPTLYVHGQPRIGSTFMLKGQSSPLDSLHIYFSLAVYPAPLAGFLWLQPPIYPVVTLVMNGDGVSGVSLPVPANPVLVGADVYVQGFRAVGLGYEGTLAQWVRVLP